MLRSQRGRTGDCPSKDPPESARILGRRRQGHHPRKEGSSLHLTVEVRRSSWLAASVDETDSDRVPRDPHAVSDVQLLKNVVEVRFYRRLADEQALSDLRVP